MPRTFFNRFGWIVICGMLMSACTSLSTYKDGAVDLSKYTRVYVEHRLADGRGVDEMIVRELKGLGYTVQSGPLTLMPRDTQIVVSYEDRWTWDFSVYYLIELSVIAREVKNGRQLASGHYVRPSVSGRSGEQTVHGLLKPLFPRKG